jgi:phosphoglycolate phosphatase-like HAD superfamily hydrolase
MRIHVRDGYKADILPGVPEVLESLRGDARAIVALLTGNLMEGARNKLQAAGLLHYFPEQSFGYSAFGSDHRERDRLGLIALRRLHQSFGQLEPDAVWIIGDSVHDISCARAAGFRVLAVASGTTPRDILAEQEPDILVDALSREVFQDILAR